MAAITPVIDSEDLEEVLADVQRAFGARLDFADCANACTFGEIFDIIARQLPLDGQGKCATAMAFYRLKAVLPAQGIRPETRLSDIAGLRYDRLEDAMRAKGWVTPARNMQPGALWLAIAVTIALHLPLLNILHGFSVATGLFVFFVVLLELHEAVFRNGGPASAETVGDLARLHAMENVAKLHKAGAAFNRTMLGKWFALRIGGSGARVSPQAVFGDVG